MKSAPIPANEQARLAHLAEHDILDTPPEREFDLLTRLAAQLLRVPIALVSIIDGDRQWFKSRYGLEAPQTPRNVSFCGHVVAAETALVVSDAKQDERFADNPLVTGEPRVRFYAGMPLRTQDGYVLGTLCAIDHEPRELSAEQQQLLEDLAQEVVALLELRRKTRLLHEQQSALGAYARFFELSADLFCTLDESLHLRRLNSAWRKTVGWSFDELRGRSLLDFIHPEERPAATREAQRILTDGAVVLNFETRFQHREGHWVPLSWSARVVDRVFYASAHDLTQQKAKEAKLRARDAELAESNERLRAVFDAMDEGVVLQTANGQIATCNPAAERILGVPSEQLIGRQSLDSRWRTVHEDGSVFAGDSHPSMVALRTGAALSDVVMGVHKPSGDFAWLAVNARPLRGQGEALPYAVVSTFRDITEQRAAAERAAQLSRQERLVTAGTLAAGVGHEINNPLMYVQGNVEFALEEIQAIAGGSPSGRLKGLVSVLSDARLGADRIRKIVRGLRALASESGPPIPTDVLPIIEIAVNMAMHELRPRASIVLDLTELPRVLADESQLTQVFVNLIVNAAQAFATDNPANNQVTVSAGQSGESVTVRVMDNGPGIEPSVVPHIFDPFFTTKGIGVGTGLGLSISHSIVTALGGELRCETIVGQGTTFLVRLPIAHGGGLQDPQSPARPTAARARVLVIDDEESVLRVLTRILERDYDVVAEIDSRNALRRFEAGERFDVVFCDLMMSFLNGRDLFRRVVALDADLARCFIFISGGAPRADIESFLSEVANECLEKPITAQHLRNAVRRFLDQNSRSAAE